MKASSFCYVPFVIRLVAILILMFVGSAVLGQANPVPFINLPFVPTSTAPGGPSFTLTVNGAGFVSGSVVMWNTTALTTTSISSTQLTATVPAADITTAGTAGITVTSPSPGGGTSSVVFSPVSGKATSIGFVNSQILQSAEIPVSITTGDFNGDGRVDLAAVNNAGSVSIFIGNGDGSFQPNVDYPTIAGANGIVAVDLLSNGSLDLVTVAPGTIAVLRGNGDGSFQTHVAYPGDQPTCGIDGGLVGGSIVAGDFNGDGKIDLAASWGCYHGVGGSVDGVTSVFLGNGDGTFQPYISNSVVPLDQAIAAGDFNLDGILDLAGSVPTCHSDCPETADLAVGNGDGTFTSTFGGLDSGLETYWPFVAAADINGDGNLDFVVCNKSDFSTLLGNGDGTAQSPIGAGSGCTSVALGDFHGNGYLDLIMSVPYNSAGTQMFPGNGTGQFPAGEPVPSPSHQSAGSVVAGDFNGDGRLDVAVASPDKTIWIDLQASLGSLSPTSASFSAPVTMNSAPQPVVLSNLSGLPIVISTITISAHFSQTNNCPLGGSLPPTASCTINVTFEPMDSGDTAGTLSITNSGLVTPLSASLTGRGQDFSLSSSTTSQTVSMGQVANYSVQVEPDGLNGNVDLTCSGAPDGSTCSLTPTSVTLNTISTVAVAVSTTRKLAGSTRPVAAPAGPVGYVGFLPLFAVLMTTVLSASRMWTGLWRCLSRLILLCLMMFVIGLPACGGGSAEIGGTPAGTYKLTVRGTYTSGAHTLTRSQSLTLIVK